MKKYKSEITGHLDISVADYEDAFEGETLKWRDVMIHGDPEGLRSFAKLLVKIADANQDEIASLPIGAREHLHLQPDWDISKNSTQVTVGRLDAKGTGEFYEAYQKKTNK